MSSPVELVSLGRFARVALASGSARLIAVFERSGYVETPAGLACVGGTGIGNGPLNAQAVTFPSGLAIGDTFHCEFGDARLWTPRAAPDWDAQTTASALAGLRLAAQGRLPSEGFGFLLAGASVRPAAIVALVDWLSDPVGEPAGAAGLIGFGPGLTPAGDDLVGGALCALRASGRDRTADQLAHWVLPLARAGTSRISAAHLACAAEGECAEAVNDAIVALISGAGPDLARIDAIGHTSGWDALAGAALVLEERLKA